MIYGCSIPELEGGIIVSCVVHEETVEGVATRRIIERLKRKPEAVVICEPSDLKLSIGQRGRCVLKMRTRGVTSHASMPELGVNAIYEMLPVLERIREMGMRLPRHHLLGAGSIAVTDIRCSPGFGPIIPDLCTISVDRRLIPGEEPEEVVEELRGIAPGVEAEVVEGEIVCYTGYRMRVRQYFPGWITSEKHWLVIRSIEALEKALSQRPEITTWRFSTDGVATAGEFGIPTVGFGPGNPSLAHQPNEHIALRDVERAALCFSALAQRLSRH
jgi:putative selenium metabolism hydrolase